MKKLQHRKIQSYCHLHVMLVTVYDYEQNPPMSVGRVAHTRFLDVRTDICTYGAVQI